MVNVLMNHYTRTTILLVPGIMDLSEDIQILKQNGTGGVEHQVMSILILKTSNQLLTIIRIERLHRKLPDLHNNY